MSNKKMIAERVKGELGMTDDEVMHRRNGT